MNTERLSILADRVKRFAGTKEYDWALTILFVGATIWDYLDHRYGYAMVMAFFAGAMLIMATLVQGYKENADGWRNLYERYRNSQWN